MKTPRRLALALLVAACRTSAPPAPPDDPPALVTTGETAGAPTLPVAPDAVESVWDYLAARYDSDRDGVVRADEYDRQGGGFERLDADGDGRLEEADFAGATPRAMAERMRGLRARMALGRLLQADDDASRLLLEELEWRATELDLDGDGRLSPGELEAATAARPLVEQGESGPVAQFLGDASPWELVSPLDADGDGKLARTELLAWFEAQDDGDGVLELALDGGPGSAVAATGPPVGDPAPDFVLQPPDGGAPVRLSAFAGARPVALVFGSYT